MRSFGKTFNLRLDVGNLLRSHGSVKPVFLNPKVLHNLVCFECSLRNFPCPPVPAQVSKDLLDLRVHFKAASSLLHKRIMGKFVKRKSKGKKNPKGDGLTSSTQWLCLMNFVPSNAIARWCEEG